MRLARSDHTSRPWRIHEIAGDFDVEDVWRIPGRVAPGEFPQLVETLSSFDPGESSNAAVRALFALRWKIGELLGWDDHDAGGPSLRDRLPADLRGAPAGPTPEGLPFTPLYLLDDEWAAEVANRTVHGVLHLGAVPDGEGGLHAQLAVLVKRNGLLGSAYMAAIRPFRYLIVYPVLMRELADMRARAASG
jgi:hypothetical protein